MNCLLILTILVGSFFEAAISNPVPAPSPEKDGIVSPAPPVVTESGDGSGTKPRCLQTLLGYYAKNKVVGALDNFNGPDAVPGIGGPGPYPDPSFGSSLGGLQGGIQSGPSQHTPGGLPSHTMDAVKNAQLMQSQLQTMNSQLQSQFGGPGSGTGYGSGIPQSPSPIQFRHGMGGFSPGINGHGQYMPSHLQQPMIYYM